MKVHLHTLTIWLAFCVFCTIFSSNAQHIKDDIDEDDEIVYSKKDEVGLGKKSGSSGKNFAEDSGFKMDEEKSNMVDLGYDFGKALRILYSNYTSIEISMRDIEVMIKKGVLTENQAIFLWESLLNSKTERNLEWLGYNRYWKNQSNLDFKEFLKFHNIFVFLGSFLLYFLIKYMKKLPKVNILITSILIIIFLLYSFYFYFRKHYFTSFYSFSTFIVFLYLIIDNLVLLSGHSEIDFSIYYNKNFKSKKHFFVKVFICSVFILITGYYSIFSLRYFLNYVIFYVFLDNLQKMIGYFFKTNSSTKIQPFQNFCAVFTGVVNIIFTQFFYNSNISYGYDINSFVFLSNVMSLNYVFNLENLVFISRNDLGVMYLNYEKVNSSERNDKSRSESFREFKKQISDYRMLRGDFGLLSGNYLDFLLISLTFFLLFLGCYLNTFFYFILACYLLKIITQHTLVHLNLKISRILTNLFIFVFLLCFLNLDQNNHNYLNEIIAIYDQKFIEALKLLMKLIFFIVLIFLIYFSEDNYDLFKVSNYIQDYEQRGSKTGKIESISEIFYEEKTRQWIYFEYLILLVDIAIIYLNYWMFNNSFKANETTIFFYIVHLIHKAGLYTKIILLPYEYSKRYISKLLVFILTLAISFRLGNMPETEKWEIAVITFICAHLYLLYFFCYNNSWIMKLSALFFALAYYVKFKNIYLIATTLGITLGKVFEGFSQVESKKYILILSIVGFNALFSLFVSNSTILENIYAYINTQISDLFKLKFGETFEQLFINPKPIEEGLIAKMLDILRRRIFFK